MAFVSLFSNYEFECLFGNLRVSFVVLSTFSPTNISVLKIKKETITHKCQKTVLLTFFVGDTFTSIYHHAHVNTSLKQNNNTATSIFWYLP